MSNTPRIPAEYDFDYPELQVVHEDLGAEQVELESLMGEISTTHDKLMQDYRDMDRKLRREMIKAVLVVLVGSFLAGFSIRLLVRMIQEADSA